MSKIIKSDQIAYEDLKPIIIQRISEKTIDEIESIQEENTCKSIGEIENERIIDEAKEEAEKIIAEANRYKMNAEVLLRKEIEKEKAQAFKKGYSDGLEEGLINGEVESKRIVEEEYKQKKEELIQELSTQIFNLAESKEVILEKYEKDILSLSITIAEKILKDHLKLNEDAIKSMLVDAMDNYKNEQWLNIYLSPDDYITVSTDKKLVRILENASEKVRIEAVQESEEGKLIIETKDTLIDASVNTQLKNMKDALID